MWDHGLDQTLEDGTLRSAYGGDFGEERHDNNFVCDGMFFPDRSPKPALHEFKYLAAPIEIRSKNPKGGKFQIFNKQFFRDLRDFKLRYEVTSNGKILTTGDVKLPAVKARRTASFAVPVSALKSNGAPGERFINFSLSLAVSAPWAHPGHEVAWAQFPLPSKALPRPKAVPSKERLVDDQGLIQVPFGEVAPHLTLWRAANDNDRLGHIEDKWRAWGLRELTRASVSVKRSGNKTTVTNTWKTGSGIPIKHTQIIESVLDGLRITENVFLPKVLNDVARVGTNLELHGELDQFSFFGVGPQETVPDRKIGKIHRWSSSVAEQATGYIKPQEQGSHVGVRWFTLTNRTNHGLYFQFDKPMIVTATPYRSTDLADSTHNVFVPKSGNTVVTLDAIQRGVGTASCGPDTLAKYIIKPGTFTWSWNVVSF